MPSPPATSRLFARLRLSLSPNGGERSDGQLLTEFVHERDEAAFAALVKRHGPMVLGVCRRVVGDWHAAEDAFQAVFVVLARRAAAVRPREQVGNWLYGVAYRTACKARAALARRRSREKQVDPMPHPEAKPADVWHDLRPVLDAELARLPDKLRLPLVLCDLEGRPQRAAARQLGLPAATLANRLAAARRLLARRLAGRGIGLAGGALAVLLTAETARAAVPPTLAAAAVKSASMVAAGGPLAGAVPAHVLQLSEEVLRMLLLSKLKVVASAVLAVVVLAGGLGVGWLPASWADKEEQPAAKPHPAAKQPGPGLSDVEFLRRVSLDLRGVPPTEVEQRYFVADKHPKKRTQVVEWMLKDVTDVPGTAAFWDLSAPLVIDVGNYIFTNPNVHGVQPYIGLQRSVNPSLVTVDYDNTARPVLNEVFRDVNTPHTDPALNDMFWVEFQEPAFQAWKRNASTADDSDEGFLRRAIQEARSVAPSTIELEYFKADKNPKKREKLLDLLLKDPAVAKKLGAGWKQKLLQPDQPTFIRRHYNIVDTSVFHYWTAKQREPGRLDNLLGQLLDGKRSDEQILEGLSLAILGRLPTESERKLVLANVGKQQDKRAAWADVVKALSGTGEATKHAEELKSRSAPAGKK